MLEFVLNYMGSHQKNLNKDLNLWSLNTTLITFLLYYFLFVISHKINSKCLCLTFKFLCDPDLCFPSHLFLISLLFSQDEFFGVSAYSC